MKPLILAGINTLTWLALAAVGYAALGFQITGEALALGIIFYFADIYLVDGALVWYIARYFGSRTSYSIHTGAIGAWKPPVLTFQILALLLFLKGSVSPILYYATLLVELAMFYWKFRWIHGLNVKKSLVICSIIAVGMAMAFKHTDMASLINAVRG